LPHGFRRTINGNVLFLQGAEAADVVEAKNMVGVRMRQKNRVDALHTKGQDLIAKIRRGIKNEVLSGNHDIQAAAPTFIFHLGGRTHFARTPNHGDSV
jgi:hypothetical protein